MPRKRNRNKAVGQARSLRHHQTGYTAKPRLIEPLEPRLLLSTSSGPDHSDHDHDEHELCMLPPETPEVVAQSFATEAALIESGAESLITLDQTFLLHSNPGANHTIYLDFDGHVTEGTTWNSNYSVTTIVSPAYDTGGNASVFDTTELQRIQRIWQRVAEDFAPFDVNVTTEDPGAEALRKFGTGDTQWGVRVVITDDTFANCGCGGHAFVGSFNDSTDEPVFVYNKSEIGVSAAATHEVGHALYLAHDGLTTGVAYYDGHGVNGSETEWGPIMGSGYYANMTTWDNGTYYNANNTGSSANYSRGADDLAVITTYNGFGFRTDDHGGTIGTASALGIAGVSGSLVNVDSFGIISRPDDVDLFSFTTGAGSIDLSINSYVAATYVSLGDGSFSLSYEDTPFNNQGSNLDILATIYNSSGGVVATSNPAGLSASFSSLNLSAGTYYLAVDGVGFGDWAANPPTGYDNYASLGQFRVTGTVVSSEANDPPVANNDSAVVNEDGSVNINVLANDSDPNNDPLSVVSVTQGAHGSVAIENNSVTYTPAADYNGPDAFTYTISDGRGGTALATVNVTVNPVPDISIAALSASKAEGDSGTTPFTFTVSLDAAATAPVSVDWSVSGSVDAADFGGVLPSGSVAFSVGQTSQVITVNVSGDTTVENDESFSVSLANPVGGTIATGSAGGTIQNDDVPTVYTYVDLAGSESNVFGSLSGSLADTYAQDGNSETITESLYQRNKRSRLEHQWNFDVTGGDSGVTLELTAGHNSNAETFAFQYNTGAGWVTLVTLSSKAMTSYSAAMPTSLSGPVAIRVVDTDQNQNETSVDSVSVDYLAVVSQRTTQLPPTVVVVATDATASETGPDAGTFSIQLADGVARSTDLTVYYTVSGSASGSDYAETLTGAAVIPAGALSVELPITPVDDTLQEGGEQVVVTLSSDAGYRLGASSSATVTIADNDLVAFYAQSETTSNGSVTGSYLNTFALDGSYEDISEEVYAGGKKSRLVHQWSFDLTGETSVTFVLDAQHLTPTDPDNFTFAYSADGGATWQSLLAVTPGSASKQTAVVSLPIGVSTVLVRVTDTDTTSDRSAATLRIDQMRFERTGATANTTTDTQAGWVYSGWADFFENVFRKRRSPIDWSSLPPLAVLG